MRLFLAIPANREELRTALSTWKQATPAIRWEAPEALHLTLRFIGAWPDARVRELEAALADLRWPPFPLQLTHLGGFPDLRRPRVLWAGIAPSPPLTALAGEISTRLAALGLAPDPRPFTPHISLARLRPGQRPDQLTPFAPATWTASGFNLYETVPNTPPATRYQIRTRFASAL
ncbi:MAG: RNA 2',3'-cyclic phosphodiesterase [Acidobacteria bacterium]|nr:MAG: RNA 2',3'-cyclic phosphodiesterase [Acidobacteriota bacterium]